MTLQIFTNNIWKTFSTGRTIDTREPLAEKKNIMMVIVRVNDDSDSDSNGG